jgi:myosin heavy subunit
VSLGEQNFHLLYYIFHAPEARAMGLDHQDQFQFLSNIGAVDCDEQAMYKEVVAALYDVGFSKSEQEQLFHALASVLHFGNLEFGSAVRCQSCHALS